MDRRMEKKVFTKKRALKISLSKSSKNLMRISIPDERTKEWNGIYPGTDFGELFLTSNIDLERNKGKVGLADSYSHLQHSAQGGFSSLTTPIAFVRSSADGTDRWWLNGGILFKTSGTNPETGWAADAIASSPTSPLYDLIDFAGALICPTSTNLDRLSTTWTTNWWTSLSGTSALSANPHRFAKLGGALIFTDGRFVNDYDGTIARDPALTLPVGFRGEGIVVFKDLAYIYGANIVGEEAEVFAWDRIQGTYNARYPVGDTEVYAAFVKDTVYIITRKGLIKRFNGTGFEPVQQFPTVETKGELTAIHPNGVAVTENIAKIFVNFGGVSTDRGISGIWHYDISNKNLYHAGSVRNTNGLDYAQKEIATVGAIKQTVINQGAYLVGAQVYTVYSGTARFGIFSSDEDGTSNQGYFITSKIRASNVRRFWRSLFFIGRRMDNADDRIRFAARTIDSNALPAYETITWLAANQFTASNSNIAAGDFVEVLAGDNAGAIARITTISGSTITIDRSLFSSTSTSRVRYLRFTDIGNIANVSTQNEIFRIVERSPWLQVLTELRGTETSPLIEKLIIDYKDIVL